MSDHDHEHEHGHSHAHSHAHGDDELLAEVFDGDRKPDEWEVLEIAIRELCFEKDVFSPEALKAKITEWDAKTPDQGAQLVARAWVDPAFKERLKADFTAAALELGIDTAGPKIVALEDTPEVHHVVVCTLCSCYPRAVLGMPPDWYKGKAYRSRVVVDPRGVMQDFDTEVPDDVEVRVIDNTAECRYLVLPLRPEGTDGLSEQELQQLVTRNSMIGVELARAP
jgi:nitrile hydratase